MLAAIILYLLHAVLFGYAARRVTEYREQPDGFWWGFWLGAFGLLMIIFRSPVSAEIRTEAPGSSIRQSWLCSKCGANNKPANATCFACGQAFQN